MEFLLIDFPPQLAQDSREYYLDLYCTGFSILLVPSSKMLLFNSTVLNYAFFYIERQLEQIF